MHSVQKQIKIRHMIATNTKLMSIKEYEYVAYVEFVQYECMF